jgi:hypothetical protein
MPFVISRKTVMGLAPLPNDMAYPIYEPPKKGPQRLFNGNYVPAQQNPFGLKLFLDNANYSKTSATIGRVGNTASTSRAVRRR